MAKLGFLLLCAVLIHTGYALQCYSCVSNAANHNCDEMSDKDKIPIATCGKAVGTGFSAACIKKVIEDKTTKIQNTTRACILRKNDVDGNECNASSDRSTVVACEVCGNDLCNTASSMQHGFEFSVFSMLVVSIICLLRNYK